MNSESKPLGEFDLIARFFKSGAQAMQSSGNPSPTVTLGIGDDCALLRVSPGEELAITSDMLVEGRHFFPNANPQFLGHKALAVNLSDLAAMGAQPIGFTLAIALPQSDPVWLEAFSKGLLGLANQFSCPLIGGDTTAGPLSISITAIGSIPTGKGIRRSGAKVGDEIWVSGTVGDARLALAALRHEIDLSESDFIDVASRMHTPTARVALGMRLRDLANAAIDVSDGLLGDLRHILMQSEVDAEVFLDQLPKSTTLQKQPSEIQHRFAACGGDDYELCFTAPSNQHQSIFAISAELGLPLTCIGKIITKEHQDSKLLLRDPHGNLLSNSETQKLLQSFDHFSQ
jgi:thiamine-monophosphate kinase